MKSLGKARMVGSGGRVSAFLMEGPLTSLDFRLGLNSLRLRVYFVYHDSLGLFFVALFWFMHEQWELLVGWRVVCLSQSECGTRRELFGIIEIERRQDPEEKIL